MFKHFFYILFCIPVCLSSGEYFRQDYTYLPDFKAFYKVHKSNVPFSIAVETCKAEGSQVLVPRSENELNEVLKLADAKRHYFWIGVHDVFSDGEFMALYDIPIEEVFLEWRNGEPNNLRETDATTNITRQEDCVVVQRGAVSVDVYCTDVFYPICKRDFVNITRNSECETYDPGYVYNHNLDRCYKFHTTPMIWKDAFKYCKGEESYLAIINSEHEANEFKYSLAQFPERNLNGNFKKNLIYLGFNDLLNEGVYTTIHDQLVSDTGYEEWLDDQPDYLGGNNHCGAMNRNGKLSVENCNLKAMFICERELSN